jgi:chromosome segregation protein
VPDRLVDEPVTVWMRISRAGNPYVEVRHALGVWLADAPSQQAAADDADRIWRELRRNGTLGLQTFGRTLYGDGQACLSYVHTRGGEAEQRDRTLLGSDVSQLSPERIAEELIALGGLKPRFDDERKHRAEFLRNQTRTAELADEVERSTEARDGYEVALERDRRIADDLDHAVLLRGRAVARATFEAVEKVRADIGHALKLAEDEQAAKARLVDAQERLAALSTDAVDEAHRVAVKDHGEAAGKVEKAREVLLRLEGDKERAEQRLRELTEAAKVWDGSPLDQSRAHEAAAEADHTGAVERFGAARQRVVDAEKTLAQVRAGDASVAVSRLRADGIDAVLLADVVEFDEDARDRWETVLHPFRDAVAVPAVERDRAVAVAPAGTLLVAAPAAPAPDGVVSFPEPAGALLAVLDAASDGDGDVAGLFGGALTVVGGHAASWTGRQARVAAAEVALAEARDARDDAQRERDDARAAWEAAAKVAAAAQAHHDAEEAEPQVAELRRRADEQREAIGPLVAAREAAFGRLTKAQAAKDGAEQLVSVRDAEVEREQQAWRATSREVREHRKVAAGRGLHEWVARLRAAHGDALPDTDPQSHPLEIDLDVLERVEVAAGALLDGDERVASSIRLAASHELLTNVLSEGLGVRISSSRQPHTATRQSIDAPADVPEHVGEATRRFLDVSRTGPEGDAFAAARAYDQAFSDLVEAVRATVDTRVAAAESNLKKAARRTVELVARLEAAQVELDQERRALDNIMSSLEQLASERLRQVSDQFNNINIRDGGFGAELQVTHDRPPLDDDAGVAAEWVWRAVPRWGRRRPLDDGTFVKVPYNRDANTAQYKLHTVQLVLAALTAQTEPTGRVLILDELGNDLGSDHRDRVVSALARAARDAGLTVLATVQDDLQPIAFRHASEVLLLHYPDKAQYLNAPTKMLATDPSGGGTLRLLEDALRAGDMGVGWRPLLDVYEPPAVPALETAVGDGRVKVDEDQERGWR